MFDPLDHLTLLDRQAEVVVAESYPNVYIHRLTLEGRLYFAPKLVQMSAYNKIHILHIPPLSATAR